ncbi:hypothetical protein chiPu_0016565 [Chiloscyllium punctatum]|uniref:Uncharacterized protein n=1 Tax=Chiloscyllium punctatum TaxID=137246 RepID=A0A401T637_CHIPU|nr:hypothetical protein [Chiloscyllium punctatum]
MVLLMAMAEGLLAATKTSSGRVDVAGTVIFGEGMTAASEVIGVVTVVGVVTIDLEIVVGVVAIDLETVVVVAIDVATAVGVVAIVAVTAGGVVAIVVAIVAVELTDVVTVAGVVSTGLNSLEAAVDVGCYCVVLNTFVVSVEILDVADPLVVALLDAEFDTVAELVHDENDVENNGVELYRLKVVVGGLVPQVPECFLLL